MPLIYQYPVASFTSATSHPNIASLEHEVRSSGITVALAHIKLQAEVVTLTFRADLGTSDESILTALIASHTGTSLRKKTESSSGIPFTTIIPPTDGRTNTLVSPDWCNACTWYYSSVRVENEALTTSDNLTYASVHTTWIDLRDGNLTNGHRLGDAYNVVVTVNGSPVTHSNRGNVGGDYTIDAAAGTITFRSALNPGDVVLATYSYMQDSTWVIAPEPEKAILVTGVEVQFATNVELTNAAIFELIGNVEVFAPALSTTNGGPLPPGTKIPLSTSQYHTMDNYIEEARGALPTIPQLGGSGWRGMSAAAYTFVWPYTNMNGQPITLKSSHGMAIRISLSEHTPFVGSRATATIYSTIVDEDMV